MDVTGLTAVELGKKIQSHEIGVREAVEASLAAIRREKKQYMVL